MTGLASRWGTAGLPDELSVRVAYVERGTEGLSAMLSFDSCVCLSIACNCAYLKGPVGEMPRFQKDQGT